LRRNLPRESGWRLTSAALFLSLAACIEAAAPALVDSTTTPSPTATSTTSVTTPALATPLPGLSGTLAYVVDSTRVPKLWSMEPDGTDVSVVSELALYYQGRFAVAPVSALVAFQGVDRHVYIIDESGAQLFRSPGVGTGRSAWSADGVQLAYWTDDDLFLVNVETGRLTTVRDLGFGLMEWSPTGSLLWIPSRGSQQPARILGPSGRETVVGTQVGHSRGEIWAWSPLGDKVVNVENTFDATASVSVISLDLPVATFEHLPGPIGDIAVSLDGSTAAFSLIGDERDPVETLLLDLSTGTEIATLPFAGSMNWTDSGLAVANESSSWLISPNGQVLLAGTHHMEAQGDPVWTENRFAIVGQGVAVGDAGGTTQQWTDLPIDSDSTPMFLDGGQSLIVTASLDGNRNEEIYLLTAEQAILLTDYPGNDHSPVPWGSRILFVSERGGERHIEIRDVASGNTRTIPDTELPAAVLAFSPEGDQMAVFGLDGWTAGLFVVDLALGTSRMVVEPPDMDTASDVTEVLGLIGSPVWSPDGRVIAVPTSAGPAVVDVETGDLTLPVEYEELHEAYFEMLVDNGMEDIDFHNALSACPDGVSLSPDGASLAFVFPCLVPYPSGVWTTEMSGGRIDLLAGPFVTGMVAWSSAGDEIFIENFSYDTNLQEIIAVRMDGTQRMLTTENASLLALSPTGSELAYVVDTISGQQIVVAEGEEARTILELSEEERIVELVWSPDGRYLAYTSWPSGLFIIVASGEEGPVTIDIAALVPGTLAWK
jgi:Tol biopolymer transport system component